VCYTQWTNFVVTVSCSRTSEMPYIFGQGKSRVGIGKAHTGQKKEVF